MIRPVHLMLVFLLVAVSGVAWIIAAGQAPTVRFELARDLAEAKAILGPFGEERWKAMREAFLRDSLFILGYTGFFVMAGLEIAASNRRLGWFVALAALAVAVLDIMENTWGLRFLALPPEDASGALLASLSMWSRLKWVGIAPLALALAWADWKQPPGIWMWIAVGAFLLAALASLVFAVAPAVRLVRALVPLLGVATLAHTIGLL